ncbi:hypothetical protein H0E87_028867 [Populus deltoides]|uniref:Uncharacterized protein n=1 Tax=Populus deltoides TaxID=3696 RepID=A0A8T2WTF8_POPDE|nr:hypothetical protein H0E87_028867 [Populus deltoides]
MGNGASVIKGFILSIPEPVSRRWHRARQLASQQLTRLGEDLVDNPHDEREKEWQKVLISTCFTSGLQIALHFHQITDSKLDSLHLVSTVFFITISIPFPPRVKWTAWIIYAISLLVIAICNLCY